jgi:ATP-binding cassette subfamily B protein RaxB
VSAATERLALGLGLGGRRLPMLLQTEAAECGLACLAMVAGWHGMHVDTAGLRRRFGLSPKGATLLDLTRIADRLGLASRPLRLEPEELRLLRTPCVLHWDMSHFVVLKAVGRGGALVVHDPAVGLRRVTPAEASRHFTGVALELTPTGGFEPASAPPRVRVGALLGRLVGVRRALGQSWPWPSPSRSSRWRARSSSPGWWTTPSSRPTATCWRRSPSASACCCCCRWPSPPCAAGCSSGSAPR